MAHLRHILLLLLVTASILALRADDVLFVGNSFTFGATVPELEKHGGVPKLFEEIAAAKGHKTETRVVTAGGKDWSYHLGHPALSNAFRKEVYTAVVLQDFSTRPTRIGDVTAFMRDGKTLSDRIAAKSPTAAIILYETWARPGGAYYTDGPGAKFSGPEQMMADLHDAYAKLRDDLAARDKNRDARVALVGTAFVRAQSEYPAIILDAADRHHATAEGYYLAALVIYEAIYHDSAVGAPTQFFNGQLTIPAEAAASLQKVADEVMMAPAVKP